METQQLKQLQALMFYKKMGHKCSIDKNDFILIAKDEDEITGIVRIREENEFLKIKGIFTNEVQKRQNSSERLLMELEEYLQCRKVFNIPNSSLKNYYRLYGFEAKELKNTPGYLRKEMILRIGHGNFSEHKKYGIIIRKHSSGQGKLTLLDSTT